MENVKDAVTKDNIGQKYAPHLLVSSLVQSYLFILVSSRMHVFNG